MNITDEMVERALAASVDLIQGFTYQERHVIRDFRTDYAKGVEIWAAPFGNHDEMMKRIEFLKMRAALEAAFTSTSGQAIENTDGGAS